MKQITLIQMYICTPSNDDGVQSVRPCGGPHFVLLLMMCAVPQKIMTTDQISQDFSIVNHH